MQSRGSRTSRHVTVAVMMAEDPERPACLGMFVSYDNVKGLSSSGVPFSLQYSENCRVVAKWRRHAVLSANDQGAAL